MEPRGLGDKIENFTKATGIKSAVDGISRATGVPCGCNKRKSILNKCFLQNDSYVTKIYY